MALEALGIFLLVVLILVGALLPLKYMAGMHLPRPRGPADDRKPEVREEED